MGELSSKLDQSKSPAVKLQVEEIKLLLFADDVMS